MFYLLSLVLYVTWRLSTVTNQDVTQTQGIAIRNKTVVVFYLASLLTTVLAMKTKENAITLPFTILLYDLIFMGRVSLMKRVLWFLPFALTLLIIPLSMTGIDKPVGEIIGSIGPSSRGYAEIERADYLFTQMKVLVTYLRLLVFPVGQNIDHEYPVYNSFFTPPVMLSFLLLIGLFFLGIYCLHKSRTDNHSLRITSFGIFFFFIALSVESSLIPIPMVINEYRLYLPSLGLNMAIIAPAYLYSLRFKGVTKHITILLAFLILIYSGATYARNNIWRSRISIWEDTVKKSPNKAISHFNLATAYIENDMNQSAIDHYSIAIRLDPLYVEAYYGLGVLYYASGMTDKAVANYRAALKLNPGYAKANNNIGAIYNDLGMYKEAIRHLQEALKSVPDYYEAHFNIGVSYGLLNLPDEAMAHLRKTVELKPNHVKAHINLGVALAAKRFFDVSEAHFLTALTLDPENTRAKELLDMLYKTATDDSMAQGSE
jgi:tetratricopeptide (TPR) repeat protein